ncbi:MAG: HD domain-containing protein [bacterium]|nr:HD domain-containing protein [bacterium]
MNLPKLILFIQAQSKKATLFIVGGFLRDRLLNRESKDIDFAVLGDSIALAKRVADRLKGAYVGLDETTARVVLPQFQLDFAKITESIEKDLQRRDFTINAIALNLSNLEIIDLFSGLDDIKNRTIKVISEDSITDDPLRLLRAVRLSCVLGFKIEPKTTALIKKHFSLLMDVAPERVNYELFEILKVSSAQHLKLLSDLGLLSLLFPEMKSLPEIGPDGYHHLNLLDHSIETVRQLEILVEEMPIFRDKIKEYLAQGLAAGHSRLQILKLACLFHDLGKPETMKIEEDKVRFIGHEMVGMGLVSKIGTRIRLSGKEIASLKRLVANHMRIGTLIQGRIITRKAIFRLVRDLEDDLIAVLLLSLADRLSAVGQATTEEDIKQHREGLRLILTEYLKPDQSLKPPKIVTGDEIMERFGLESSPLIGEILSVISEGWVDEKVKGKEDAFILAEGFLKSIKN